MIQTRFDPNDDLIIIKIKLWGPLGDDIVSVALDTAASDTLIVPDVLDALGYNPRHAEGLTSVTSVVGIEKGYRLRVDELSALGYEKQDFIVNAHDLPPECGIQGLLGLNFLRDFNYEIRSKDGVVNVSPVDCDSTGELN